MRIENTKKVTRAVVAEGLGVSTRTVTEYTRNGILRKNADNSYDLFDCIRRFIEVRILEPEDDSLIGARKRLYEEQQRKLKMQNDREAGRTISTDQARLISQHLAVMTVTHLKSFPGRMASVLAGVNDPAHVRRLLLEEVTRLRSQLFKAVQELPKDPPTQPPGELALTVHEGDKATTKKKATKKKATGKKRTRK